MMAPYDTEPVPRTVTCTEVELSHRHKVQFDVGEEYQMSCGRTEHLNREVLFVVWPWYVTVS